MNGCRYEIKSGYYYMLLIIGILDLDENKMGLYFLWYEYVYLCNVIKCILIVDEYL